MAEKSLIVEELKEEKEYQYSELVNLLNVKSIRNYYQFKELRKNGKRFKKSFFDLIVLKSDIYGNKDFGLAVITSKKVGNAVKRNKIRRWINEYFRRLENCIPFNINYLIVTKPGIFEYGRDNILKDIKNGIEKIRKEYV